MCVCASESVCVYLEPLLIALEKWIITFFSAHNVNFWRVFVYVGLAISFVHPRHIVKWSRSQCECVHCVNRIFIFISIYIIVVVVIATVRIRRRRMTRAGEWINEERLLVQSRWNVCSWFVHLLKTLARRTWHWSTVSFDRAPRQQQCINWNFAAKKKTQKNRMN